MLLCGADASTLVLVDQQTAAHSRDVNSVDFSPDGTRIVSGSDDSRITIWSWMAPEPPQLTLTNTLIERTSAQGSEAV